MKSALFTNFTDREFVGWWDGKAKKFAPGQSLYMPDYLAKHFAKHLVNQELLRTDKSGTLIYKDGDKMTSPKFPEQVPLFMELFNQAFTPDETEELGNKKDDVDSLIDASNKNRQASAQSAPETENKPKVQDPKQPQVIVPPDFDQDEDEFQGKPQES